MLAVDLGIFNRRAHVIKIKEALVWSAVWISLSLLFNLGIFFFYGSEKALEFLTSYLIEKSLSIDNIFVFIMIFSYFRVPPLYQHKVLFWGIIGALVMRGIFMIAGVTLIHKFHSVIYIVGTFLIYTGFKMAVKKNKKVNPERNTVLRLLHRFVPTTNHHEDGKFFVKQKGKYHATPLLIVLLFIETTNIVFAVDSIPAVLAITTDLPIVYTSNVFAILGLRALYFALAGVTKRFYYLRHGLIIIIMFVGIKMLLTDIFKIPTGIALGVIASVVFISLIASIIQHKKQDIVIP
ncbi:MAG: TerC family protein [Candidatus Mariimomonas ferrooxydans]